MSRIKNAIARLKSLPKNYTYIEARNLLVYLGFEEKNKGRTSGSRVLFFRDSDNTKILLHKPHPGNEMKKYAVQQLLEKLKEIGDIL